MAVDGKQNFNLGNVRIGDHFVVVGNVVVVLLVVVLLVVVLLVVVLLVVGLVVSSNLPVRKILKFEIKC